MSAWTKLNVFRPLPDASGGFSPSPAALRIVGRRSGYVPTQFPARHDAGLYRVMVLCTEDALMTMANGRRFLTGNHPVETLVPMLHLTKAGFECDIYTPTGKPVALEKWAMPRGEPEIDAIFAHYKPTFEAPKNLESLAASNFGGAESAIAVFIPGGHGAMLGLPQSAAVDRVLRWARGGGRLTLAICHGPAALLATARGDDDFLYRGYEMKIFPDSIDRQTPWIGYLPGKMPWYFGEKLREQGARILNHRIDGSCHRDRDLITGDSPRAANAFGILAANTLIAEAARRDQITAAAPAQDHAKGRP